MKKLILLSIILLVGCRPFEEYACDEINAYNGPNAWDVYPYRFTNLVRYDQLHVPNDCYYCADQTALFWIECNSDEVNDCMKDCKYCPDYVNKIVNRHYSDSLDFYHLSYYSGNIDSILFDNEFVCCFINGAINRNYSGTPFPYYYEGLEQFYDHKLQDINSQDSTYCIFEEDTNNTSLSSYGFNQPSAL